MEKSAQAIRNKEANKLNNKLKNRQIMAEATYAFTKSKNLYKSWVRHLWAQRTGALNYQGAMEATNNKTTCPLCQQQIKHNITWHALLDCQHQAIQVLYAEFARKNKQHWEELISKLSTQDKETLLKPTQTTKIRGRTERGDIWGGWIHELGDISMQQYLIITAAHPGKEMDYIFKAQKALTHHNTTILNKYTELAKIHKGPDNGIRITMKLQQTQEQKQANQQALNTMYSTTTQPQPNNIHEREVTEEEKWEQITKTWKTYRHKLGTKEQEIYKNLKLEQHFHNNSSHSLTYHTQKNVNHSNKQQQNNPSTHQAHTNTKSQFLAIFATLPKATTATTTTATATTTTTNNKLQQRQQQQQQQ